MWGDAMGGNVFSRKEMGFIIGISAVLGLRQFGMMLIMPFLSEYGKTLSGSTPALIGLSLGVFGLTQGCFQIPYGIISDRTGRKPVVLFGIILQIAGFITAFYAKSIQLFILARALQGSGAINATALSWVGDSIDDNKSNRAMGMISSVSGGAIALSLVGSTILQKLLSIPQIFLFCAILSMLVWLYILIVLKENRQDALKVEHTPSKGGKYPSKDILINKPLLRLYGIGFAMNFMLMGLFFIFPLLEPFHGSGGQWKIFIPATITVALAVKIVSRYADNGKRNVIQMLMFICFAASVLCLFANSKIIISIGIIVFFTAYMCQYSLLTSGINLAADEDHRGSVNGIANTFQFIGAFFGGTLSGMLWGVDSKMAIIMLLVMCLAGVIMTGSGIRSAGYKSENGNGLVQNK